jgi:basic membrane protein A
MKRLLVALVLLTASLITFTSCSSEEIVPDPVIYKVGLVSGLGGFSDGGFNQNILAGFTRAAGDFPLFCETYECQTDADIGAGIRYFTNAGFDLVITAGFDAADSTIIAAQKFPGTSFLLLDFTMTDAPDNLLCAVFDVDQASFPCGFLAAWWANTKSVSNPVAGFVAGPEIPEIRQFSVSYLRGITYYNTMYGRNVQSPGYYASSFTDTLQGAELAGSLMEQGATVVFAFAGRTGNGALYKMKEAGKWAIGVDVDQYYSIPQVGPALLTSCMKELDVMVYNVMALFAGNEFYGGTVIHGDLSNGGVGMAPFHDFEAAIPDSIRTVLDNIKTGIKNGSIDTGWPE